MPHVSCQMSDARCEMVMTHDHDCFFQREAKAAKKKKNHVAAFDLCIMLFQHVSALQN